MPIYEYRCGLCGKEFEVLVLRPGNDKEDIVCPYCKSKECYRMVSRCFQVSKGMAASGEASCIPSGGFK